MSIFKAVLGICDTKPLGGDLWSLEGNKARVKLSQMPEPLVKGGAVYLKGGGLSKPVLLLRTEDDRYLAFEDRCTHFGRKYPVKRSYAAVVYSILRMTLMVRTSVVRPRGRSLAMW